jgi:signal transduction histidine kinase
MSIGGSVTAVRLVKRDLSARAYVGLAVGIGLAAAAVAAVEFITPVYMVDPGERGAIEMSITLSAILTAGLLIADLRQDRRLSELLLLFALVVVSLVDFIYFAVPALAGGSGPESDGVAPLASSVIVSLAFAAAALAPSKRVSQRGWRPIGIAIAASAGALILALVLTQLAGALAIRTLSAAILLVSAAVFLRRGGRGETRCSLLAAASLLLAAARLQYLSAGVVGADWVTPREGLRLAAYAILLASAYWQYAKTRRAQASAAIRLERERIARDLHDGLAQDLACIAAQGQGLGIRLAPEHPLMIAARHALATSRGVIAELAASSAPDTEAALRLVAEELEYRYGLRVDVQIDTPTPLAGDQDLGPSRREHVVRIAREAIVNAALHGAARHVDVVLQQDGKHLVLCISDDGCGIEDTPRSGLGLQTMRARAASLGGELSARRLAGSGTELKLVV